MSAFHLALIWILSHALCQGCSNGPIKFIVSPSAHLSKSWLRSAAENLAWRSQAQKSKTGLLAVFTWWRKTYNQSKSGFMAKRQIFPPLQPWEILNVVEGKEFCCTGWGKEECEAASKGQPWLAWFYTARQEDPVLRGQLEGYRFATTGDRGQALLSPTLQAAECQNCRDVSQCILQRGWLTG